MREKVGLKQSDLAMLILVVAIAMTIAYLLGNSLINTPQSRSAKVEIVNEINSEISVPDETIFADGFINPTELIEIGNANNQNPFGNGN